MSDVVIRWGACNRSLAGESTDQVSHTLGNVNLKEQLDFRKVKNPARSIAELIPIHDVSAQIEIKPVESDWEQVQENVEFKEEKLKFEVIFATNEH